MSIGLIITIVAASVLVVGLVLLLVFGLRPRWPDGEKSKFKHFGHKQVVILRDLVSSFTLSQQLASAQRAMIEAWKEVADKDLKSKFDNVGLLVLSDAEYVKEVTSLGMSYMSETSATLTSAKQMLGSGPALIIVRSSALKSSPTSLSLLIHELMHHVEGLYHDVNHNSEYWNSIVPRAEELASMYYSNKVRRFL